MKPIWTALVAALVAAAMSAACVPALTSTKRASGPGKSADGNKGLAPSKTMESAGAPSQGGKDATPKLPTDIPLPPPPDGAKAAASVSDLAQRAEINQAALAFCENLPNVKLIKTCFSKIYGGWNLDVYMGKGKKIAHQVYQWNAKSKEWELVLHQKDVEPDKVDSLFQAEAGDEKCFWLKK